MPGYGLLASPTLYAGQTVRARVEAGAVNPQAITCGLHIRTYGPDDKLTITRGPAVELRPGASHDFCWQVGDTGGWPIAEVGLEIQGESGARGTVYLDFLTWDGPPAAVFTRPERKAAAWWRAWVDGVDQASNYAEPFRLVQNQGRGLLITGTREWADYRVTADVTPHLVQAAGLAARVQGMQRYYALLLCTSGKARLVKALDGETVLAEADFPWELGKTYELSLRVKDNALEAGIDGTALFQVEDVDRPLTGGGVALVCEEGRTATQAVSIRPVD